MTSAVRLIATTAALGLLGSPAAPDAPTATLRPALEMIDLSPARTTMVTDAVELFARAGLDLPPLVVRRGEPGTGCAGHDGLHHPHDGWSEIELCAEAMTHAVVHTVLHEMAHAWAAHSLTAEHEAEFHSLRGYRYWRNYTAAAWEDNGTEQAAEIVAWGVDDRATGTVRISDNSWSDLHAGYVALTGVEPSYGLTAVCMGTPAPPKS
jgi:hypothetical protein